MKTTLEISDELFRHAETAATLRGESLEELVTEALQSHLDRQYPTGELSSRGWRSVFGQGRREDVEAVDAVIDEEFERVDPDEWR